MAPRRSTLTSADGAKDKLLLPQIKLAPSVHTRRIHSLRTHYKVVISKLKFVSSTAFCDPANLTKGVGRALANYQHNALQDLRLVPPCTFRDDVPEHPNLTAENFERHMDEVGIWNGPLFDTTDTFLPPPFLLRLTDAAVFQLWHRTSVAMRASWLPKDFGQNGEVRTSRLPAGGPVLCFIYGIPFVAVYNNSYMLAGDGQNWGPLQCATAASAGKWHFGAVVASPQMVRHPDAFVLPWSPKLSYNEDPTHIVLCLQDGAPAVLSPLWKLRGLQLQPTPQDLSEFTITQWVCHGNPRPMESEDMTGKEIEVILQDVDLPPNTIYPPECRAILKKLEIANASIADAFSLTLQHSSPITNLASFRPPLTTATPSETVADEQLLLALRNIKTRLSSLCAPTSDTEADLFSIPFFSNPLWRYALQDETLNSIIRDIILLPQKKDLARRKADLLAAPYMDIISDIADAAHEAAANPLDPDLLSARIHALSPEHAGIVQMVMDNFDCTI